MKKDSKAFKIRELILEILSDSKVHTTKEIMKIAIDRGIIPDKNTDNVYNILFHMKKDGLIDAGPDKSQYVLRSTSQYQQESRKEESVRMKSNQMEKVHKGSILNIDKEKYSLLKPMPSRFSKMSLTVKEDGELKMNGALMNNIKERNIEIYLSKDLRTIVLNPKGECTHRFTKAGTTKNKELVSILKRLKIKFPISYDIQWSEPMGAWEGVLNISEKI